LVLLASIPGVVGIAIYGKPLISILFGHEFLASYLPMLLMLPGIVGMSYARISQTWLLIYGRGRSVQRINLLAAGIATIGWVCTIPIYGLYAAAIVSSLAYAAMGFATYVALRRATVNGG
jgi:O-antigen/teichoic acid export membrane protein